MTNDNRTTCMNVAETLEQEASALRTNTDNMLALVECYNSLEFIHHEVYKAATNETLSDTLDANGICDLNMELVKIMAQCITNFDENDTKVRYEVINNIMNIVYFLHYLHNMS